MGRRGGHHPEPAVREVSACSTEAGAACHPHTRTHPHPHPHPSLYTPPSQRTQQREVDGGGHKLFVVDDAVAVYVYVPQDLWG